jgi:hypothetical protein
MARVGKGRSAAGAFVSLAAACLLWAGAASAQVKVETITPDEANRPLTFSDWCSGIKHYDAARCAAQSPEDKDAFDKAKSELRAMNIGSSSKGCEGNPDPSVRGRDWSFAGRDCRPVDQPTSDLQPFPGPH